MNPAITGPVVLDLLQGCRSEPEPGRLEQYLRALHCEVTVICQGSLGDAIAYILKHWAKALEQ